MRFRLRTLMIVWLLGQQLVVIGCTKRSDGAQTGAKRMIANEDDSLQDPRRAMADGGDGADAASRQGKSHG